MTPHFLEHLVPAGGVVVGYDGSPESERALQYAVDEAGRRGTSLHVIRAWSLTNAVRPDDVPRGIVPSYEEFEAATAAATREQVERLVPDCQVPVEVHAVHGSGSRVLIEASTGADVLVVGRRGRGGFSGLLLGSVADQCVSHASTPVVVVG